MSTRDQLVAILETLAEMERVDASPLVAEAAALLRQHVEQLPALDNALEALLEGHEVSDARKASLLRAVELGATTSTLEFLRDARRLRKGSEIALSPHRYEGLSRGKGWCRKGKGSSAEWAEKNDDGNYLVGPGKWTVGGNDGFSRKGQNEWRVEHVQVGNETWTVAE